MDKKKKLKMEALAELSKKRAERVAISKARQNSPASNDKDVEFVKKLHKVNEDLDAKNAEIEKEKKKKRLDNYGKFLEKEYKK